MSKKLRCCFLFGVCSLIWSCLSDAAEDQRKVYIVYMGSLPEHVYSTEQLQQQHLELLEHVVDPSFSGKPLITSYGRSFNGFTAYLTHEEKNKLASHHGVVSVFPSRTLWPQTTRSWDYVGLTEKVLGNSQNGSDIIIGVLDSGVWPEAESFSDKGFRDIPKKWKGECDGGIDFTCNKKLIGARYYDQDMYMDSARDTSGHGTHTASTAGGNYVKDASFYGIAGGTARGGLPSARIAAYRVCRKEGCSDSAILSAFDDAIADGVDVITISVGSQRAHDIREDSIAIGSLHAMQKGILTVHAAGNSGFAPETVNSVAPWLFTVAASTMDRGIVTKVNFGNGKTIVGKAVNPFKLNGTKFPLGYGKSVSRLCGEMNARRCLPWCLDESLVKGKIVVCDEISGINEAFRAGAVGAITVSGIFDVAFNYPLPASALLAQDLNSIKAYIKSTEQPKASIPTSEVIENIDAPKVASFSSKGPNPIIPNILKPDITAPGVEILAAYSPAAPVSTSGEDKRSVKHEILSGTSMSCPHVAGAAAYVKSVRPDWSASAIKSALMTTAQPMDRTHGNEFGYGAGHLNPLYATNPGLVYETGQEDYIKLLCKLGYSDANLRALFNDRSIKCSSLKQPGAIKDDFNYPSMTIKVETNAPVYASFRRTVTNVGLARSTYRAMINRIPGLRVSVTPRTLLFRKLNQKKSFLVTVRADEVKSMASASIVWSDGIHTVRSPIVVYKKGQQY